MNREFSTISIIGLGYIGLPTAALFASKGVKTIGVDINKKTVDTINKGEIHITEPRLGEMVADVVSRGYLRATTKPESSDAFLIAVPTPFCGDHQPDLSYVEAAVKSIAIVLKKGDLVILESTSPVGTTEYIAQELARLRPDLSFPQNIGFGADINIAYCPERVLPGNILHELVSNDRVIGGMTSRCSERATLLYKKFVTNECIETSSRTAEMCKLTENSFRDVNIAFANEISMICGKIDINVWELISLANLHPRVNILEPGPGVGGHCIAVDPWFIISKTPHEANIIRVAREVNNQKPKWVLSRLSNAIKKYLDENPSKRQEDITISCFGLTYKPNIDDLRESPSSEIVIELAKQHSGHLLVVEPNINSLSSVFRENIKLVSIEEAQKNSQIVLILVAHKEFYSLSSASWGSAIVIDICGLREKR